MDERVSTVNVRNLRDTPDPGLSGPSTPEERLALVETLTREAWALAAGEPQPYARFDAPVHVRRLRESDRTSRR